MPLLVSLVVTNAVGEPMELTWNEVSLAASHRIYKRSHDRAIYQLFYVYCLPDAT